MIGQTFCGLIGLWLIFAPSMLEMSRAGAVNATILGVAAASFAVMALWELMRPLRWVNFAAGAWLTISAFAFYEGSSILFAGVFPGLFLMLFSLIRGTYRPERFGGGWAALL